MRVQIFSDATDGESISVECGPGDKTFEIVGDVRIAIQASVNRYTWVEVSRHVVTTRDIIRRSDNYPWWRVSILNLYSGTVDAWCNDTIPQRQRGTDVYGSTWFPEIGDGSTDITDVISDYFTRAQSTGRTVKFDSGDYLFSSVLPDINGFYIEMAPDAKLIATGKTGLRLLMTGERCGIIGGEIQNRAMRRYRVSSITSNGSQVVVTLLDDDITELGAHSFEVGHTVYLQNVVLSSGSINNTGLTVASVTSTTVTLTSSAVVNSSVTYPYERLDGHARTIYPVIYRSRTTSSDDSLLRIAAATDFRLQDCTLRWSAAGGVFVQSVSHNGIISGNTWKQTAADALHITSRSYDVAVRNNKFFEAGDDSIALVGYKKDGGPVHSIRLDGNEIYDMWFNARGLALVGCSNVQAYNTKIEDVYHAGILIDQDTNAETYANTEIVIDGFSIKTSGSSGTVPTGWNTTASASLHISHGTNWPEDKNRGITICNGKIMNSRYRAISSADPAVIHMYGVDVIECNDLGMIAVFENSHIHDMHFDRTHIQAMDLSTTGSIGLNRFSDFLITNVNRGTRLFLKSASVSSGTLTMVLEPGQSHSLAPGSTVIVQWIGSAYASATTPTEEVRKDFDIGNLGAAWTLATVTADSAGDILTVTGTGNEDTSHVSTRNLEFPCRHAYISLSTGAASTTDGITADTDAMEGRAIIERIRFGELLWPMEKTVDNGGGSTNQWRLWVKDISCDTDDPVNGDFMMLYHPVGQNAPTANSTDSAQSIGVTTMLRGEYTRSGLSTGRTDTFPAAGVIVEALKTVHASFSTQFIVNNLSAQTLTLAAPDATVTLSGTMTVAATTRVWFTVSVTNATPGSEAVTITRRFAQSGLGA